MELNIHDLRPLTKDNLDDVFKFYEQNEEFFKISKKDFENQTLGDFAYNPELSLVYYSSKSEKPIAVLIGVVKKGFFKKNLIIKMCLVGGDQRRKGIGTQMFSELIKRAKPFLNPLSSILYGFSPPQFMEPGVDVRHTSLIFFLQSMGLNQRNPRKNLTVHIPDDLIEPSKQKNGFYFQRITTDLFASTLEFVKKEFIAPTWSAEVELTFSSKKPTTFIALDSEKKVVGFASHATCFNGSFGPTGVAKSVRGKGIGGELLKWCLWDIKTSLKSDTCTIMYVVGNTVKYYSKTVGAYINPVFIPMSRSILYWWNLK
jgi:GNAT superfamily N-acetyltransferase/predicted GNAT family acetyltransferase